MVENRESLWISVVASAAAGLLLLSGCSSDSTASSSNAKDLVPVQYSQIGVLPVVMDIAYAPFGFFQGDDTTPTGFDVDLITGVAEVLGLQVELYLTLLIDIWLADYKQQLYLLVEVCQLQRQQI